MRGCCCDQGPPPTMSSDIVRPENAAHLTEEAAAAREKEYQRREAEAKTKFDEQVKKRNEEEAKDLKEQEDNRRLEEPFRSKLKADFREEKSRLRSLKTDQELQKQAEQEAEEQRKREALQQEAAARERDVEVQKEKEKKDADELAKWLADNGFSEKNHRKRKCCSVQYPLHAAVADKSPPMDTDVVQLLLNAGANMDVKNFSGKTPLQLAMHLKEVPGCPDAQRRYLQQAINTFERYQSDPKSTT